LNFEILLLEKKKYQQSETPFFDKLSQEYPYKFARHFVELVLRNIDFGEKVCFFTIFFLMGQLNYKTGIAITFLGSIPTK